MEKELENEMGTETENTIYDFITLIGTSHKSWQKAAEAAVQQAAESVRDLRIAEIQELDMQVENGKIINYRAKVKLSFKYETSECKI